MTSQGPAGEPLGVGIIGTGAATQAIHLPVLAGLRDRLRVTHIVGSDERHVAAIARRAHARSGTSIAALLDDPAVDLVAVCTANHLHAAQVTAACAAGKRGVLVEKPMAATVDEAEAIRDASTRFGVPVVVGAMHVWDPAWVSASREWLESGVDTRLIRSTIQLPTTPTLLDHATDIAERRGRRFAARLVSKLGAARRTVRPPDPAAMGARLRAVILALGVHVIPLIRVLAPALGSVSFARPIFPWGYSLAYDTGRTAVTMTGTTDGRFKPVWTFDAWAEERWMHVDFPPSYVMTGSAEASICGPDGRMTWRTAHNGYAAEWQHLADVAEGRAELAISVGTAADDLAHAISLAEAGAERLRRELEESTG